MGIAGAAPLSRPLPGPLSARWCVHSRPTLAARPVHSGDHSRGRSRSPVGAELEALALEPRRAITLRAAPARSQGRSPARRQGLPARTGREPRRARAEHPRPRARPSRPRRAARRAPPWDFPRRRVSSNRPPVSSRNRLTDGRNGANRGVSEVGRGCHPSRSREKNQGRRKSHGQVGRWPSLVPRGESLVIALARRVRWTIR